MASYEMHTVKDTYCIAKKFDKNFKMPLDHNLNYRK